MAAIRGRGNRTTEVLFAEILRSTGMTGWRRHYQLPGTPDFVFAKERVAIFIDGCFWHGCARCRHAIRKNKAFWETKIAANRARDRRVVRQLKSLGWRPIRIWEHSLKRPEYVVRRLGTELSRSRP